MGSKQTVQEPESQSLFAFQTDPCGVEAQSDGSRRRRRYVFQTDPCGVEAGGVASTSSVSPRFQTDPCGVEADGSHRSEQRFGIVSDGPLWGRSGRCYRPLLIRQQCFRRTLVGSKHRTAGGDGCRPRGFRRTLVGSKLHLRSLSRREGASFQTDPCGVEASLSCSLLTAIAGFRRTLVGSKLAPIVIGLVSLLFQTDPCGVEAVSRSSISSSR